MKERAEFDHNALKVDSGMEEVVAIRNDANSSCIEHRCSIDLDTNCSASELWDLSAWHWSLVSAGYAAFGGRREWFGHMRRDVAVRQRRECRGCEALIFVHNKYETFHKDAIETQLVHTQQRFATERKREVSADPGKRRLGNALR